MQTENRRGIADSFRGLMAAIINRALADLGKDRAAIRVGPRAKDEAMAWVSGPDCEVYCLALDMDYTAIREKAAALYRKFLAKTDPVIHVENGIKRAVRVPVPGLKIGP
jgi:hypothetical protein